MYRSTYDTASLYGLGADGCAAPAECDQAMRRYPAFVDKMRVLSYCDDSTSEQSKTEIMCLQALADGEKAAKNGPVKHYPWHEYSSDTETLQEKIGGALSDAGMCALDVDGRLGAATCGAARYLSAYGADIAVPDTCAEFSAPKQAPCAPSAREQPFTYASVGSDNTLLWLVGSLAAVAAASALMYFKK